MQTDPLDVRAYPAWVRVLIWASSTILFVVSLDFFISDLAFSENGWTRWAYLAAAGFLFAWFTIDALFARRTLYARINQLEGTLKHGLRFWRRIAFLTLVVVGLALAVTNRMSGEGDNAAIDNGLVGSLTILAGAYFASFGWMYTRYEQEKADRASATLGAIRDQLYGPLLSETYQKLVLFKKHCDAQRTKAKKSKTTPFTKAELALRLEDVVSDVKAGQLASVGHEFLATQFINALNQLSLGVRKGQFDLGTIRLLLRPRFLTFACRYHTMIVADTKAKPDPEYGNRMRAQTRTYEHFLWLITKIDMLQSDLASGICYENIVLPPDHIVGTEEGEKVKPPKRERERRSIFGIDHDLIWDGIARADKARKEAFQSERKD